MKATTPESGSMTWKATQGLICYRRLLNFTAQCSRWTSWFQDWSGCLFRGGAVGRSMARLAVWSSSLALSCSSAPTGCLIFTCWATPHKMTQAYKTRGSPLSRYLDGALKIGNVLPWGCDMARKLVWAI